ncbi:hypothetical protein RvY_16098-2 [Ramazzottius varieornatus]|uniref:Uncharacterized protein n=1 Tax=Ramazzottius varieornatus TaxID=947166 RepID=A0A1D1VX92_RAMVA|nr:hypothetical protein RvY_16098-2 [Ramazzottius varieornatus]
MFAFWFEKVYFALSYDASAVGLGELRPPVREPDDEILLSVSPSLLVENPSYQESTDATEIFLTGLRQKIEQSTNMTGCNNSNSPNIVSFFLAGIPSLTTAKTHRISNTGSCIPHNGICLYRTSDSGKYRVLVPNGSVNAVVFDVPLTPKMS